jgi:hypothetical protein
MASKKIKRKDPYYYKLDKYECWWEDHASSCEWKDIKEASKDTCEVCFTEGYLIKKTKYNHIFTMSFSHNEVGDEMIIANKNILKIKKIGSRTFYKKDFDYNEYKN